MELRHTLLQSDIDHMAKNFRVLSAELITLQDFIQKQFGTKFSSFCDSRRQKEKELFNGIGIQNNLPSLSTLTSNPDKKKRRRGNSTDRNSQDEDNGGGVDDSQPPFIIPDDSDAGGSSNMEENGDQEEEEEGRETKPKILRDMATLYQTEPCRRTRGGRTKSVVHRYFEKVKMDDGKFKHRCFNCGNFVSPQAQRMRNHLMKCRGKDKSIVSKLLKKTRVPDSNKGTPPKTKMGRTADCVRLLFTETKSPEGYLKMKCNNCGALVSPQADRMKKHLKNRCGEDSKLPPLSKKELEEYEDEDEDSDDSDFSLSSEDESPKRKSSLRSLTSSSATSSQQQNNSTPDDNPSHSSRQVQSTTSNSATSALNFTGVPVLISTNDFVAASVSAAQVFDAH